MPDTFSPEERSRIMRAVKGADTALEVRVRSALWRMGLRFRKNVVTLPGKPDIAFTRRRLVIFIDSCFWHGCPLHLRRPKSNQVYWEAKIARNQRRDLEIDRAYQEVGWTVLRVWEHELNGDFDAAIDRIVVSARGADASPAAPCGRIPSAGPHAPGCH